MQHHSGMTTSRRQNPRFLQACPLLWWCPRARTRPTEAFGSGLGANGLQRFEIQLSVPAGTQLLSYLSKVLVMSRKGEGLCKYSSTMHMSRNENA